MPELIFGDSRPKKRGTSHWRAPGFHTMPDPPQCGSANPKPDDAVASVIQLSATVYSVQPLGFCPVTITAARPLYLISWVTIFPYKLGVKLPARNQGLHSSDCDL